MPSQLEKELDQLIAQAPEIREDAEYWFVRTQGGSLLEAFIGSGSIAVGYSRIPLAAVPKKDEAEYHAKLKALIAKQYPQNAQPGFAANQIWTFSRVMKRGDFVLCPAYGASHLALGVIADDAPYEEELEANGKVYSDFRFRRKVKWVKQVERGYINPKLFALFFTHQAIVSARAYAPFIDSMFYDFFRKAGTVHYAMDVERHGDINAPTLFFACSELLTTINAVAESADLSQDARSLNAKVNLNSPGIIEFVANHPGYAVTSLAVLVIFLNGGGLKVNISEGFKFDLSSEGIIKRMSDALDARNERRLTDSIRRKLEELEVKDSDVMVELLQNRRGKNQK